MAYRQTRTGRLFIGSVDVTDWTGRQRFWWLLTGREPKSRHPIHAAMLRSWWLHRGLGHGRVRSAFCAVRAAVALERFQGGQDA
jgi:hypothetical protein